MTQSTLLRTVNGRITSAYSPRLNESLIRFATFQMKDTVSEWVVISEWYSCRINKYRESILLF